MIEYLGIIATVLFVTAMIAQALKSYRDGHANDVSHLLIWKCGLGYILMTIYVLDIFGWDWILHSSYLLQAVFLGVVIKYKYWPRSKK